MFIQCSACNSKYLVNSADLKPDGRMVECATCNHQWYQVPIFEEELLSSSTSLYNDEYREQKDIKQKTYTSPENQQERNDVKNLPSTIVKENNISFLNSILVLLLLIGFITGLFILRSYGTNIFVLLNYYINEFYFNFRLIISDIAKIIHQLLN